MYKFKRAQDTREEGFTDKPSVFMDPLPKTNLSSSDQMSQRLQSPKDFVTRVLSPRIAVLSSPDADQVCQASNFPDFLTLIKPFGERIEGKGS